jgi:hypothetical protein
MTVVHSTSGRNRAEYLDLRQRYEPESTRLVIIAESPPASGKYFYDPAGAPSEPLFAALMKQLRVIPHTKEGGLREFQRRGWILVDATYEPVNKAHSSSRYRVIERDYPLLRDDLATLMANRSIPIVLIKENVCRILRPKLVRDGFNVLSPTVRCDPRICRNLTATDADTPTTPPPRPQARPPPRPRIARRLRRRGRRLGGFK